ncbi:MAG: nitroreductase family deazaflavin-dependent oxidoreductase [Chloroflexota bacterium]
MRHRPRRRASRGSAADDRPQGRDGRRHRRISHRGRGLLDEPDDRSGLDARTDLLELAIGRAVACSLCPAIGGRDPGAVGKRRVVAGCLGLGQAIGRALGFGLVGNALARHLRIPRAILKATGLTPTDRTVMEDELVASGRFVRIEAQGARSGLSRAVTVGFVDDETQPGSVLVAANSPGTAWARNLLEEPACHVRVGERSFDAVAEPLEPAAHARAIRGLILRYGTPAEGLGRGPSFRLRPVEEGTA